MITTFDHVTVAVRDVDAAVEAYERLTGSPPSWRGGHPDSGTVGALFSLGNAVIELTGPGRDPEAAAGLVDWLDARGEGMQALAFGTNDASACVAALKAKGVRAAPPQEGEARGDDGGVRRYRSADLSPRSTRGLAVVVVEREGPSLLASGAPADGAEALDHVMFRTADPEAAIALYGGALGIRLALDQVYGATRHIFFRVAKVTLEVIADESAGPADVFGGFALRTRDVEAMHARLRAGGVNVSDVRDGRKAGTRVFTVRGGTCGVPVLVIRDPSRD
ncbi:MAG TPA: VOC family protein [Polyangiaceae bacterium]|jgi:catechol 2,3-dioxygenase-like lactoylglutathione lyase family enzyme|nr:VOC family protein [Polyangiaceae bacterium]